MISSKHIANSIFLASLFVLAGCGPADKSGEKVSEAQVQQASRSAKASPQAEAVRKRIEERRALIRKKAAERKNRRDAGRNDEPSTNE